MYGGSLGVDLSHPTRASSTAGLLLLQQYSQYPQNEIFIVLGLSGLGPSPGGSGVNRGRFRSVFNR